MVNKFKKWCRGIRLAFDPGYPLVDEFLPSVWKESASEKAVRMRHNAILENLALTSRGPVFQVEEK